MEIMEGFQLTDFDREIWDGELDGFVPRKIFDAHVHLWNESFATPDTLPSPARLEVDLTALQDWTSKVFPGREPHFLLLGTPIRDIDFAGYRQWMALEAKKDPLSRAGVIVSPELDPRDLARSVAKYGIRALKPYRVFASDPANCDIFDFLPEPLIEVANEFKMLVVLHISKFEGISNEKNLSDLKYLTSKYPQVTWQLAHCARGFNPATLEKAIDRLKYIDHLAYDTSAVNDLYSHYLLLKHEDRSRIMFGSDNIVASGVHGKYITWGKGWDYFPGMEKRPHCDCRPTLVIYEQLRVQRQAAVILELSKLEIENLFYNNAKHIILGE